MSYLRFQIEALSKTGKPTGIFAACWRLEQQGMLTQDESQCFMEIRQWFIDTLPQPPFYDSGNPQGAVTYFKSETTRQMIVKLHPLVKILVAHGVECELVQTDNLGSIVYEDEYQVGVI